MQKRFWRLAGLAWAVLALLETSTLASEDVAQVLQRQTQEMLAAVSSGSASVWDRYLDAKAV